MRNLNQHQQTLQQAMAGLSQEQMAAIAALTQRLKSQPDRPNPSDTDEELMRKAQNLFQQLSPAEQALLAQLGQGFQSALTSPAGPPPAAQTGEPASPEGSGSAPA